MNPVSTVTTDYKKWITFCPKLKSTEIQHLYKAIKKAQNVGSCSCSTAMVQGDRKYLIKVQLYSDTLEVTHSERISFLEYLEKHYLLPDKEEPLPKESIPQIPSKIKFAGFYAFSGFLFEQFIILPGNFGYRSLEDGWILVGFIIPWIATFSCIRVFRMQFKEDRVLFPTDFLLTLNCCMMIFTAITLEVTLIDVIKTNSITFANGVIALIIIFGGFLSGVIIGPLNYLTTVLIHRIKLLNG